MSDPAMSDQDSDVSEVNIRPASLDQVEAMSRIADATMRQYDPFRYRHYSSMRDWDFNYRRLRQLILTSQIQTVVGSRIGTKVLVIEYKEDDETQLVGYLVAKQFPCRMPDYSERVPRPYDDLPPWQQSRGRRYHDERRQYVQYYRSLRRILHEFNAYADDFEGQLEIQEIAVEPSFWGRGACSDVLEFMKNEALAMRCVLTMVVDERMKAFMLRKGDRR
ncbi:hypothetical protein QBC34DRAFT_496543 [Podospora aff. communis PSN243]|uniref:N-acetyltransferase domain-containing protein n=1 Tax=Podospora aff. communis PSN243 TaxID=3040156 RepID=A0AAV9GI14_9PEZI|nr:hypothetical protein QBC34DRAFT_496543 [Podospora aff. communis PSN243]